MDKHKASEKKASLAINVAKKEMDILNKIDYKNGYSLYIGIPFCPSICLYCSFSSYALDAYKNYVEASFFSIHGIPAAPFGTDNW